MKPRLSTLPERDLTTDTLESSEVLSSIGKLSGGLFAAVSGAGGRSFLEIGIGCEVTGLVGNGVLCS